MQAISSGIEWQLDDRGWRQRDGICRDKRRGRLESIADALSIPLGMTVPANATTTIQMLSNLDASSGTAVSPASQQTGSGITAATTLKTGSVLAISDGTNNFSYTTARGRHVASVVAAINGNANFSASLSGTR